MQALRAFLLLCFFLVGTKLPGQSFKTLHSFNGADGASPYANLVLDGSNLYGMTPTGGLGAGVVFALKTDGTGFTNIHVFPAPKAPPVVFMGLAQSGGLLLSKGVLFGTTPGRASLDNGSIFALNMDGTGFTNLYTFTPTVSGTNADGAYPVCELVLDENDTLYGSTTAGGPSGNGTIFAININGTGFTNLYSFSGSDGSRPQGALALSVNRIFGATVFGGSGGNGTIFAIATDGTGFTNLYSFSYTISPPYINPDGVSPQGGVILSQDVLYGAADGGGALGHGTIFRINTDGSNFTNLHNLSDEAVSLAPLILVSNSLYGATSYGYLNGAVFAINTDGTGYNLLYRFGVNEPPYSSYYAWTNRDGLFPRAVSFSGNTFYGVTANGGSFGCGTVFAFSMEPVFRPQLAIAPYGPGVIFRWPTNTLGFPPFVLKSRGTLYPTGQWYKIFPPPYIIDGQNVVSNPLLNAQNFIRLERQLVQ